MPKLRPQPAPGRTPLAAFVARWSVCTACDLRRGRTQVVLARGSVPCDVLFCAEAPGHSEDTLGLPMVGPAGHLFDGILARALGSVALCATCGAYRFVSGQNGDWTCRNGHFRADGHGGRDVRYALANTVCCIPLDEGGTKATELPLEAIRACQPRLLEFVLLCRPRLIVAVGSVARDWLDPKYRGGLKLPVELGPVKLIDVAHPAAVLRAPVAQRDMMIQRCVVQIANAVEDL